MSTRLGGATECPANLIEVTVLEEAADWLTLLHAGEMSSADYDELRRWQQQSPMHQAAWVKAEAVMGAFSHASGPVVRSTLSEIDRLDRRRVLKSFAFALIAAPAAWLIYEEIERRSGLYTGIGEQKSVDLADGTEVILNTSSVVKVNYTARSRNLALQEGEVLITTGKDSAIQHRPFTVSTSHGTMRALGTHFSVRQFDDYTQLVVLEGAVEINPYHSTQRVIVEAGEKRLFTSENIQAVGMANDSFWQKGMLLAESMPLHRLVSELSRYRKGVLRCDPAIAGLRVSGAFSVNDTDESLDLLQKTMPVKISRISPWWVMVEPK